MSSGWDLCVLDPRGAVCVIGGVPEGSGCEP